MPRTGLTAEELKRRAVEIAHERITALGYEKLRVTDVAAELGISHAALYGHFSDKADLLDAVVRHWLACTAQELERITACTDGADPATGAARLEAWLLGRLRLKRATARRDPHLYEAYCAATIRLRPVVQVYLDRTLHHLARLLRDAVPGLTEEEAMTAGDMLRSAMAAYSYPQLVIDYLDTPDAQMEAQLRDMLDCLLRGLRARVAERG